MGLLPTEGQQAQEEEEENPFKDHEVSDSDESDDEDQEEEAPKQEMADAAEGDDEEALDGEDFSAFKLATKHAAFISKEGETWWIHYSTQNQRMTGEVPPLKMEIPAEFARAIKYVMT